jgi:hypothetical protein
MPAVMLPEKIEGGPTHAALLGSLIVNIKLLVTGGDLKMDEKWNGKVNRGPKRW